MLDPLERFSYRTNDRDPFLLAINRYVPYTWIFPFPQFYMLWIDQPLGFLSIYVVFFIQMLSIANLEGSTRWTSRSGLPTGVAWHQRRYTSCFTLNFGSQLRSRPPSLLKLLLLIYYFSKKIFSTDRKTIPSHLMRVLLFSTQLTMSIANIVLIKCQLWAVTRSTGDVEHNNSIRFSQYLCKSKLRHLSLDCTRPGNIDWELQTVVSLYFF